MRFNDDRWPYLPDASMLLSRHTRLLFLWDLRCVFDQIIKQISKFEDRWISNLFIRIPNTLYLYEYYVQKLNTNTCVHSYLSVTMSFLTCYAYSSHCVASNWSVDKLR